MKTLFTLAALTLAGAACAQGSERPITFIAGIGITGGGSKLATVQYNDGRTQDIRAGSGVMLYLGGEARVGTLVSLQATFGYHVDSTNATNGDVRFGRYPIDLLAYVPVNEQLRFGAGAQFVNNARLKGSGVASNVDVDFDSNVGFVLEGEYRFTPWLGVKLRGVNARYKVTRTNETASGNHFGLLCNLYF
jgi:Outer membrane protein beta-barrel domain